MKKKIRYTLLFVNKGDPFTIKDWTTEKHEAALDKMTQFQEENKELSEKEIDKEMKHFIVHETLLETDANCDIERIRKMHPIDLINLFNDIYNAGRTGIYYKDFREEGKETLTNQKSKSIGKKNSRSSKNL
jgi:hypothetical protein